MTTCKLTDFGLTKERGFLPHQDPLRRIARSEFNEWEEVAVNLPKYMAGLSVRRVVDSLPPFPLSKLNDSRELQRAMVILSFIGHAYVFGADPVVESLPSILAVPWSEVADKLGRPPVLSYESYALDNWHRIDPTGPIAIGNIALNQNFLGGIDEEWFVIIHVDIEAQAGLALASIASGRDAVIAGDVRALEASLKTLTKPLEGMYRSLCRMGEHCDPYVYFNRVRPYIHGWKNNPALPNGLLYEGSPNYQDGQFFRGETGAQSGIIPSLDGFLGVGHSDDPLKAYLMEMRLYMPSKHREFLEATESGPSTRMFVEQNRATSPSLTTMYNECVEWVEKFRSKHLEYAVTYIANQAQKNAANPSQVGTGGTPFVKYLTKHRDETGQHAMPKGS